MNDLLDKARLGDTRAIARLITAVENDSNYAQNLIAALYQDTGKAHIIGLTGSPGCGKSTLVNQIAKELHTRGTSVAIIAVDPSSPFSGGAILGDRVRMSDLALLDKVFVRSMASRGTLGGLAQATASAIKILDAAGFDTILVETVGAGQAEVDIASVAHTVLVIEAPGSGDEVQSFKAGILEIADIFVVNKADRPSVMRTVRSLEMMLQIGQPAVSRHHGQQIAGGDIAAQAHPSASEIWDIPVLTTIATEGQGITELVEKIEAHRRYSVQSGEWFEREWRRSRQEVERLVQTEVLGRLQRMLPLERRNNLFTSVARREVDPYVAAQELLALVYKEEKTWLS